MDAGNTPPVKFPIVIGIFQSVQLVAKLQSHRKLIFLKFLETTLYSYDFFLILQVVSRFKNKNREMFKCCL